MILLIARLCSLLVCLRSQGGASWFLLIAVALIVVFLIWLQLYAVLVSDEHLLKAHAAGKAGGATAAVHGVRGDARGGESEPG